MLPNVPRYQCFPETKRLIRNPIDALQRHTDRLGPNFIYYFGGAQKVLISSDPAVIRHILKDNHSNYHKSPIQTRHMVNYLGRGLLSDPWEEWRPKRMQLQKGFRVDTLDKQAVSMHAAMRECLPEFERLVKRGPTDLAPLIGWFVFSMTARALFDIRIRPDEIRYISQTVSTVQAFMVKQVFQPYLNPWFHISGQVAKHQKLRRHGDALLLSYLKAQHAQSTEIGQDSTLLDILFSMMANDAPHPLSLQQVLAEAMQFLVAGHETSSNTLSWTMTLLDQHPHYLAIMLEEWQKVLGTRPATFSDLRQLPYTQAIINESMRLYPPFWALDRIALADDQVEGKQIRKGESIMCFLYGLHRSKGLWEDADSFKPERFLKKTLKKPGQQHQQQKQQGATHQHPVQGVNYLPFGNGPRRCIGEQIARLQMVLLLQMLYQQYEITLTNPKVELAPHFTLSRRHGLMARVRPLYAPQTHE